MKTAKVCVEIFSDMNPNDPIGLWYLDKELVFEKLEEYEFVDSQDNPVELDDLVTNSFVEKVINQIADDDSLWERFAETLGDVIMSVAEQTIKENEQDKELWDTETEKEV